VRTYSDSNPWKDAADLSLIAADLAFISNAPAHEKSNFLRRTGKFFEGAGRFREAAVLYITMISFNIGLK